MITDLAWLSREAQSVHDIFVSLFYSIALTMLIVGVVLEYFKFPLGGVPQMAPLVGRVLVAAIMLHSYPDISNLLSELTDGMAAKLGNLNEFHTVLSRMGEKLGDLSLSWTSVKETVSLVFSFVSFFLLYVSVFIANAGVIYVWVLLYVFSPLLIALFILPGTASATKVMFRSMFEVCAWKIVWSVLATLLWSAALSEINKASSEINFLTVIAFNLILAASVLFTPLVVNALTGAGIASMTSNMMGMAAGAALMNPGMLATKAAKLGVQKTFKTGMQGTMAMQRKFFPSKSTTKAIHQNQKNSGKQKTNKELKK